MTQEEKQVLIKDLCARQPYGVIVNFTLGDISFNERVSSVFVDECSVQVCVKQGFLKCPLDGDSEIKLSQVKPYLRPMSSMTEEEEEEYDEMFSNARRIHCNCVYYDTVQEDDIPDFIDWLNEHYFDYRKTPDGKTLIESGLALEAKEGMYKTE